MFKIIKTKRVLNFKKTILFKLQKPNIFEIIKLL